MPKKNRRQKKSKAAAPEPEPEQVLTAMETGSAASSSKAPRRRGRRQRKQPDLGRRAAAGKRAAAAAKAAASGSDESSGSDGSAGEEEEVDPGSKRRRSAKAAAAAAAAADEEFREDLDELPEDLDALDQALGDDLTCGDSRAKSHPESATRWKPEGKRGEPGFVPAPDAAAAQMLESLGVPQASWYRKEAAGLRRLCKGSEAEKPPTDGRARVTKLLADLNATLAEAKLAGEEISEGFQALFTQCFKANASITKATSATVLIATFYGAMDRTTQRAAKKKAGAKGSSGKFGKYKKADAATCLVFIEDFVEWAERKKGGLRDTVSDELWLIFGTDGDEAGFGAAFMASLERLVNADNYSWGDAEDQESKIRMICSIWQSSSDFAQWTRGKFLFVALLRHHQARAVAEIQQENEDFVSGMLQAGKMLVEGGAFDGSLRDMLEDLVTLDPDDLPGLQVRQEGGRQFMKMAM